ncbi:acyltransferase domain-containing protein [Desulfovibrio sp. OttesenSCG-928-G15]|nr:acyltransferase domain-containing protein [Desulfovibrio sp. OttesenSCG-928-G15]
MHLANPNPAIDFAGLNLTVPTKLSPLPKAGGDELVGVNSFGFGGTNAHVVLQKPPKTEKPKANTSRGKHVPPLFLSARSDASLRLMAEQYLEKTDGISATAYYDLAAATILQREAMPYRAVVTGKNLAEITAGLKKLARNESSHAPQIPQSSAKYADAGFFAFSGNGSQWVGMGAALIAENIHFARAIRDIDTLLAPLQGWSCEDMLTNTDRRPEIYELTEINQPLLFAVQVAVVETLKANGLRPQGVTGHSVGEVAAAWASGALSLKDAVLVIHHRSRLQGKLKNKGTMAVVEVSPEKAEALLAPFGGAVEITAINTDNSITVAGPNAALKSFIEQCKAKRLSTKMLAIAYPFHTSAMDDIKDELLTALAGIKPQKPTIPFYSTVHGKATTVRLDATYWWNNLRKPVLFSAAVKDAYAKGFRRFLEIGPSPVLRSYFRKLLSNEKSSVWVYPVLLKAKNEVLELEAAWKNAWRQGWALNMRVHFPSAPGAAALPIYPWDREFLWSDDTPENRGFLKAGRIHPLLGWPLPGNPGVFENTILPAAYPWIGDHVAGNGPIYPAAAFLESMLAAAAALPMEGRLELERVNLFRALPLSDDAPKSIRISVDKEDGGLVVESKTYMSAEPWSAYARARVVLQSDTPAGPGVTIASPESFGVLVDKEVLYKTASRFLLHYGPAFQSVSKAWVRSDNKGQEVLARLSTPVAESAEGMFIPPTLTDGALQTLFILLGTKSAGVNNAYLPVFFDRVILHAKGCPAYVHGRLERTSPRSVVASFRLLDQTGKELLCLNKCRFRRAVWLEQENVPSEPYVVEMTPSPRPDSIRPLTGLATASLTRDIESALSPALATGRAGDATGQGTHAYMLLQLAALSAMHETILSLCGGPEKELNCNCTDLLDSGALSSGQEAWFNHMLERLQASGLAAREGEGWRVFPRGSRPSAEALWRTVLSTAPGFLPEATLLGHVFKRHEEILGGKYADKEHELLAQRLIDNYFLHSLALQPFSAAAKSCVASVLRAGKSGQLINIMQISKNSTGLVTDILPLLDKRPCSYVVAEKDAATAEARALSFGNVPGLSFCALDVENPADEHANRYHLIILGWSAHEHLDHETVFANCRAMLAPGGILCLVEHSPTAFASYVFGARPSWWAASPHVDKPVSLLTDRAHWARLIDKSGLRSIALPRDAEGDHLPAFVLLAQKTEQAAGSAVVQSPAELPAPDEALHGEKILLVSSSQSRQSADLADTLAGLLEEHSPNVQHIRHGVKIQGEKFDLASPKSWERLFKGLPQGKNQPPVHIVYLAAYDTRDNLGEKEFADIQFTGTAGLMELVKAWDARKIVLRITVIAGGALADGVPAARPVPSQGAISGFTRVLMNEQRGLETRFIDVHGPVDAARAMLPDVVQELISPETEPEVVLCGGVRFAPRLLRLPSRVPAQSFATPQGATLTFDMPGRLQNLYWKSSPIPQPGKGEVCIEVKYTGLNYRDVLWSMGMLLDEALENGFSGPTMGIECSGTIAAVGQGVKGWAIGDPVLCFSPAGFSTHVITSAGAITRKPDNISFAEAAGIPVAFITAWYSIKHLARMQRGEKLLIHGAAGGVGLAAVQIAAHLGLEVFATAGAPEK